MFSPNKIFQLAIGFMVCSSVLPANCELRSGHSPSTSSACPISWVPYNDEKCFHLVDSLRAHPVSHEEALDFCAKGDPSGTLPTIHSVQEQTFLITYLFNTSHVLDFVWLGASQNGSSSSSDFVWDDGTPLDYSNWAAGSPRNHSTSYCVQMEGGDDDPEHFGKWRDVDCGRSNVVVCQAPQQWDLAYVQKLLLEQREEIERLKNNPVPLGFVYTQYGNDPEPHLIWPGVITWTEVSEEYAGLFFRVVGGDAAPFGVRQEESTTRISAIHDAGCSGDGTNNHLQLPVKGSQSGPLFTGTNRDFNDGEKDDNCALFTVSGDEVRPMNQAVRLWKRTA